MESPVGNKPLSRRASEALSQLLSSEQRGWWLERVTPSSRDPSPAPRMLGSVLVLCPPRLCTDMGFGFCCRLTDKAVKDYSVYRSSLLFWALVDLIYNMFKVRGQPGVVRVLART